VSEQAERRRWLPAPWPGRRQAPDAPARETATLRERASARLDELGAWAVARPALVIGALFVVSRLIVLAAMIRAAHWSLRGALELAAKAFDAGFYQSVAGNGYGGGGNGLWSAGFYPGYPLLVTILYQPLAAIQRAGLLPGAVLWTLGDMKIIQLTQLVVSNLSLVVALVALWHLYRPRLGATAALIGCCLLLAAPNSFFFSSGYSESSFLAATALAFVFAERGRWVLAGVAVGMACLIRAPGAALLLPLGIVWLQSSRPVLSPLCGLPFALAGMAFFPSYTWFVFGDPLLYEHIQTLNWNHAFSPPWPAFVEILHRMWWGFEAELHYKPSPVTAWISPKVQILDGLTLLWGTVCGLLGWLAVGVAQAVWVAILVLYPLFSGGNPLSTNRLVLVAFPLFFVAAWLLRRRPILAVAVVVAGLVALFPFTTDHVTGRFVG
jgi:hypothetical protein